MHCKFKYGMPVTSPMFSYFYRSYTCFCHWAVVVNIPITHTHTHNSLCSRERFSIWEWGKYKQTNPHSHHHPLQYVRYIHTLDQLDFVSFLVLYLPDKDIRKFPSFSLFPSFALLLFCSFSRLQCRKEFLSLISNSRELLYSTFKCRAWQTNFITAFIHSQHLNQSYWYPFIESHTRSTHPY